MNEELVKHPTLDIIRGTGTHGLRWAKSGEWRIAAYAEGGWVEERFVEGPGWCLLHQCDTMPEDVGRALCTALGLEWIV